MWRLFLGDCFFLFMLSLFFLRAECARVGSLLLARRRSAASTMHRGCALLHEDDAAPCRSVDAGFCPDAEGARSSPFVGLRC